MGIGFYIIVLILLMLAIMTATHEDDVDENTHIRCFSGRELLYDGYPSGSIHKEGFNDIYSFYDKKTNKHIEITANCILTNNDSSIKDKESFAEENKESRKVHGE